MNLASPLKKFTTSSGHTYAYVFLPPNPAKPTILFLHGFPSAAYDWRHQVSHFSQSGYGVLTPDLLGYGSSSKPDSAQAYKGQQMASDIVDLLDHEKIDKVHGVGHDWGSYLLSRLANYHSNRFYSYSFLGVGYMPPNVVFDLESANAELKREVGYDTFGFWEFFLEEDAAILLKGHVSTFSRIQEQLRS
jgi:soluble epoxide hydrolase/lipid-phosphate phosphatase